MRRGIAALVVLVALAVVCSAALAQQSTWRGLQAPQPPDAAARFAAQLAGLVQSRLGPLMRAANSCEDGMFEPSDSLAGAAFKAEEILDREGYRRRVKSLFDCEVDDAWRFSIEGGLRFWSPDNSFPGDELSLTVSQALGLKLVRPGERMDIGIEGRTEIFRRDRVSQFLADPVGTLATRDTQEAEFNTLRCFVEGRPGPDGGWYAEGEAGIKDLTTEGRPGLALDQRDELSSLLNLQAFGFPGPIPGSIEYEDTRIYCQISGGYEAVAWKGHCRARFEVGALADTSGKTGSALLFDSRLKIGSSRSGREDAAYLQAGVSGRGYADGAAYCSILAGAGADIIARNGCTFRLSAGFRYDVFTDDVPGEGSMESFFRDRAWGDSDGVGRLFFEGTLIF